MADAKRLRGTLAADESKLCHRNDLTFRLSGRELDSRERVRTNFLTPSVVTIFR